ncbi:MAG: ABC transporter ATP-binding protein [Thermoguttaceae bacterium]|jgi:putative ABC transport system ATP-binding protein
MALVEIRRLTKRYRKGDEVLLPLDAVDLAFDQGEFLSLMGASGTGKSTLLNLIAGIDRADDGQIVVGGTEVTRLSRSQLADWRAAHLGYIFQTHNLIPVLTAYENVELPLLLLPMSSAERRKRVELAMEAVGLLDRMDHYPRQLSGGQEQRVGIARAIVANPTVVVADEPTGNLDANTGQQIQELLTRLNAELGMTILMVTHDAKMAQIATRQLRLENGKIEEEDCKLEEEDCKLEIQKCKMQIDDLPCRPS